MKNYSTKSNEELRNDLLKMNEKLWEKDSKILSLESKIRQLEYKLKVGEWAKEKGMVIIR